MRRSRGVIPRIARRLALAAATAAALAPSPALANEDAERANRLLLAPRDEANALATIVGCTPRDMTNRAGDNGYGCAGNNYQFLVARTSAGRLDSVVFIVASGQRSWGVEPLMEKFLERYLSRTRILQIGTMLGTRERESRLGDIVVENLGIGTSGQILRLSHGTAKQEAAAALRKKNAEHFASMDRVLGGGVALRGVYIDEGGIRSQSHRIDVSFSDYDAAKGTFRARMKWQSGSVLALAGKANGKTISLMETAWIQNPTNKSGRFNRYDGVVTASNIEGWLCTNGSLAGKCDRAKSRFSLELAP